MPLSDKEKTEARDALALALELNEPESMLEGLKRLCVKKAFDKLASDEERQRWRNAADALIDVQRALESDKERQASAESASSAPDTPSAA